MKLWEKVDSIVLRNFHDYWEDPLVNKFLGDEASKKFEGLLLIRKNKKPLWISHPFNYVQAKKHFFGKAEVVTYNSMEDIKTNLCKYAGKYVGYNPRHQTVTSFKNLKKFLKGRTLVNVEEDLAKLREQKNSKEVKNLSIAAKETRKVIALTKKWVRKGITEKDLYKKIHEQLDKDGFDCAFVMVAFNKNTAHIHHSESNTKLEIGPVLIDMGAKYKGYCADISETFYFGEEKNEIKKSKEYIEFSKEKIKVSECITKIESLLKPGTTAKELWKATKMLGELPHALGHGIGIEVHDVPSGIGEKSKFILKEGMVLAIEPAIYTKKFGIRIENDYLITKKGFRILG
ncbi:MAG: Xaa-Pro peptidase family protein [archaeon]